MKKILLVFTLFCSILFSAQINESFIKDKNATTIFKNILKDLQSKNDPQSNLQKTIIYKILNISKEKIKPLDLEKIAIKNQKDFIDTFIKVAKKYADAQKHKISLDVLQEQLDDIEKELSNLDENATNVLTLQLEYAYYYKKIEKYKKDIDYIEKNFYTWLSNLYPHLKKIKFNIKNLDKQIKDIDKKIILLDKKIKKLNAQKERWEILEKEKYVKNIEKEIKRVKNLKDSYLITKIELKLNKFFYLLKNRDEKVFELLKEIDTLANNLSKENIFLKDGIKKGIDFFIEKEFGKTKTIFYKFKENTFSFLKTNTFFNIPLYKFAAALGIFLLFLFFRKLFALIILKMLKKMASKTKTHVDDAVLAIVEDPLKFSFIIVGFYLAVVVMDLENEIVDKIVRSMIILTIFWLFYDAIAVLEGSIYNFAKKFGKELYREIGNFFIKTLKIFIFAVGLVAILQEWNINVSAFIASLGLGGLAFALAAKDTASNLFGGLTILADKSLKIDDWIKVGDVEGTVEDIGLRTIKVRTFEKSLVTVPNQIVANNPIENFSRRDIRRIKMRIGVTYSTTKSQMDDILKNIRNLLKSHPQIDKNSTIIVNFDNFEDSSLSIFIYCFTNTANWQKYLEIKEDINLKIMDIVEKAGAEFAFPSQSIYVEKLPKIEEK
ncbi:mechanosensitive ion channel domain-containing protein [Nitrosophilus kaiyonis]|uniref:mechanosensitive ion channel domain-containing protein n=1 Tax=Nitrosophilus kaiyonis TaxID=2930200 RepID=UPI0024917FB5|nr:mechanosensitive ion channel domain-containing protein [Nitrosophilus kaiyonis]